ncbi:MAG: L-threonylcarbamoyladenylate synthase [Planctomycetota bacterium]
MLIASADAASVKIASRILATGGLVAIPTETVYGLAASLDQESALKRIFEVKRRPSSHPLIVHVPDAETAVRYVRSFSPHATKLATAFWPGPLTLVLPRTELVPDCVTGSHHTVGIRVPSHPVTLQLLRELGTALAAPSANRFTQVSPTRAAHVAVDLGHDVDLILDGGPCEVGVESTVLDLTSEQPTILRPGGISREAIELVLEQAVLSPSEQNSTTPSPGQHHLHYSPRARVQIAAAAEIWKLAKQAATEGKRVRVFASERPKFPCRTLEPFGTTSQDTRSDAEPIDFWLLPQDLHELAKQLYNRFREADRDKVDILLIELPPNTGLGQAIRDRIRRAGGLS